MLRKQATDTKTCLYIMTKFPLAMYHDYSTRDSCSIKLHNRKIWHNIYRTEFIIRQAVPLMEQHSMELTLQNLLNFLADYCICIFTTENQMSVYQLYGNLHEKFPIKDKELLLPFQYDGRRILHRKANRENITIGIFDKCNHIYLKKSMRTASASISCWKDILVFSQSKSYS